ncbi:ribonuclease-3 family protein [Caloramator fervidus]|uniref:Mini-ribonuclease 3 n=1 Tax=Caloramator fervidus TaxID=29344 RepID=A0A1H5W9J8_9CLOT|nr:ribonuclease III domain-containing protein [Caloramator fervidus]SEF96048.1 ribonuclease-3 family protein [Caloramator fervidus]
MDFRFLQELIDRQEKNVKLLNPLIWAYVGDVVYEMYIRTYLVSEGIRTPHNIHVESVKFVKASNQSKFLEVILPYLTEEEVEIVRRGRNAKSYSVPKNANVLDYRRATALEALFGYLYLNKRVERIDELFKIIFENIDLVMR